MNTIPNENSLMTVPAGLNKLVKKLDMSARQTFKVTDDMLEQQGIYDEILTTPGEGGSERKDIPVALSLLRDAIGDSKSTEYYVATASDQSSGKSMLTNVILEYPLVPTAVTTTTACATEIHYGEFASIEIKYYKGTKGNDFEKGGPVFDGRHPVSGEIWKQLLNFALSCIRNEIIFAETLQYFSDKDLMSDNVTWQDINLSPNDERSIVQLLLILFTTYVGQNEPNPTEEITDICDQREDLLKMLGVDSRRDYAVSVTWNHPALSQGMVMVDLPGLNSSAKERVLDDGTVRRAHEQIAVDYLSSMDSIFLFFIPTAIAMGASKILQTLLDGERMKHIVTKENRIIPIINKVDERGGEKNIPFTTNTIRGILGSIKVPCVYPMSAISGEYRFVQSGLIPIHRTLKYQRECKSVKDNIRRYAKIEPTEEMVEAAVIDSLKDDYEHPYSFTDWNDQPHQLSLGQWIDMMTTDYMTRIQSMKTIELVRIGYESSLRTITMSDTRVSMLNMLKEGGEELTKNLISTLVDNITKEINNFNRNFTELQEKFKSTITGLVRTDIPKVESSYLNALDKVERDISSLIRGELNNFRANAFGNIIINPEHAWTEDGRNTASSNQKALERLIELLKNFQVVTRLKDSEKLLTDTIQKVQDTYTDSLPGLCGLYDELPSIIARALDESYDESQNAFVNSGNAGDEEKAERKARYESIYSGLFDQLRQSILREIEQFADTAKAMLIKDQRITDQQKATIDQVTAFCLDLQAKYDKAAADYVETFRAKTRVADSDSFDKKTLEQTLDQPLFTDNARKQCAASIVAMFTEGYAVGMLRNVRDIQLEMNKMNTFGLKDRVNGLNTYIIQKIRQGKQSLETSISNLKFYIDYIRKQIRDFAANNEEAWTALRGCSWAVKETDEVDKIFDEIIKDADE